MYSPLSVEPRVVRTVESCWNLVILCSLMFQRWEKDLGIPRRSWLTGGNPPCGWARATSRTRIGSERTKEVVYARSARLAEHSSSLGNLSAVVDNTTETEVDDSGKFLLQPDLSLSTHAAPEVLEDEKEEPMEKPEEDE